MSAVETRGLSKAFGRGRSRRQVVDRLDLSVPQGVAFGYLGPNGAGKTTTIRMLCGVLPPSAGEGTVAGADLRRPERVKARIGYANQGASVYGDLTVEENLEFRAALYLPGRAVAGAVDEALARMGLGRFRARLARELSGGWRQRLVIGAAVIHRPQVIFLDEPTASVDPAGRRDLWDIIYDLTADGLTVFVSTHYMEEAERCHRIALIDGGRVLAEGSPEAIKQGVTGSYYVCEPERLGPALQLARSLPGVAGAWISGNSLRMSAPRELPPQTFAPLGVPIRRAAATLEDAFVHLTSHREAP